VGVNVAGINHQANLSRCFECQQLFRRLSRAQATKSKIQGVNMFKRVSIFVLLLAGCLRLQAQATATGILAGTVTDPTGAVVPNASVKITNKDTGLGDGGKRGCLRRPDEYD
jgi:hypothetical protein